MSAPKRPCTVPRCPNLVGAGETRCAVHASNRGGRDAATKRSQPWRDYGAEWRRIRERVLAEQPWCQCDRACCPGGCRRRATVVDHIVPLRDGGTHDRSNLRALAKPCHDRRTARDNTRGFAGRRR